MSFGREASPWGSRVHAAADQAGRRLRAASERAADRAWYAKYDLVRWYRSAWLRGRARARLRIEALLWWIGVVRERAGAGPVRMALGVSLTLLAGAVLAAGFIALTGEGGSAGDTSRAEAEAEGAVAGRAHNSATRDATGAAHPADAARVAVARPPVSPGAQVAERPAPAGSPPAAPKSRHGLERTAPAPPRLLDRRPTTVTPGAPRPEPGAGPVAPAPAPTPAPAPPAREKPDRPAAPPAAQEKPERPAAPPPAQEKPEQPAAPPPGQAEREHPRGGPPGQQEKEGPPGQAKKDDSPGHGNGHQGRPDGP